MEAVAESTMIVNGKPTDWQTQARQDDMIFIRAAGEPRSNPVRNYPRSCRERHYKHTKPLLVTQSGRMSIQSPGT
jgi:hypothetical protein